MNIAIDVGNTLTKVGVFQGGKLIRYFSCKTIEEVLLQVKGINIENVIISSVNKELKEISEALKAKGEILELSQFLSMPFTNQYKTPQTLGTDRLAGVAGAISIFPSSACLVIDMGSCITYDFIDKNKNYFGGGISPGMNLRFKSLNSFTAKLPLISPEPFDDLIGGNTKESILSGVVNGISGEINWIIERYQEVDEEIKIVICGGDAKFFETKIKERIFVIPELVVIGLNRILEHNVS